VNIQFDWWLLIVGLVVGAGLTWLVVADIRRRDDDLSARERAAEAEWIASEIRGAGIEADTDAVSEVLRLHRLYLASLPADDDTLDEPAIDDMTTDTARSAGTAEGQERREDASRLA
jgi:hypothetical protein